MIHQYKSSSKKQVYYIYLIAGLMIVVPACISSKSSISSIGFFVAIVWILIKTRNLYAVTVFCLLMRFNSNLCEIPIIGMGFTLMPIVNLILVVSMIGVKIRIIKTRRINLFLLVWALYITINNAINSTFDINSILSQLVNFFIAIYFIDMVRRDEYYSSHLLAGVLAAVSLIILVGTIEIFAGRTFFYSLWRGGESVRYGMIRPGSTLADPNFMALIICAFLFIWRSEIVKKIVGNRISSFYFALSFVVIAASGSRTTYFTLVLAILMIFLCKRQSRIIFALPLLLVIIVVLPTIVNHVFFSVTDASSSARIRIVVTALELWSRNKVIGLGYGSFSSRSIVLTGQHFDTMNTYVQQLVDYGVVGLFFYLTYALILIYPNVMKILFGKELTSVRRNRSYCLASVISWFSISLSLDTFTLPLFWIYPAILTVLLNENKKDNGFE